MTGHVAYGAEYFGLPIGEIFGGALERNRSGFAEEA